MFYVPEGIILHKEKISLKLIQRFHEDFNNKRVPEKASTQPQTKLLRKRYKTISEDVDRNLKLSPHSKSKNKTIKLPLIVEKKFLLKGKVTGQREEKGETLNKMSLKVKTDRVIRRKRGKGINSHRSEQDEFMVMPWQDKVYDFY